MGLFKKRSGLGSSIINLGRLLFAPSSLLIALQIFKIVFESTCWEIKYDGILMGDRIW
jgi:hypothetical protein